VPSKAVDALSKVPLLEGLAPAGLEELAESFRELTFPAGATVTREGERGARMGAFFIITAATATVTKGGTRLNTLGPGDFFGEIALFHDAPRMATVTADGDLSCLALGSWEFRPFVEANPLVAWQLLETMSVRLADTERLSA
jgi:CRP-like cAMP-binding protein